MYYLIKVPGYTRPYLTSLNFIAQDFEKWGQQVSVHEEDSEYMIEVKYREGKQKLAASRPSVTEMWAKQFMSQRAGHSSIPTVLSQEDTRLDRMSRMIEDFFRHIAAIGESVPATKDHWWSPKLLKLAHTPLPKEPGLNLVVLCMRLLRSIQYTQSALVLDSRWTVVDSVVLYFRHNEKMDTAHILRAVKRVEAVPGRLSAVWSRDETTGMGEVRMSVDVGDCVAATGSEGEQPSPLYAAGGKPPVYEAY